MMNKKSRWLAAILSVMMVFCYMPSMAFAASVANDLVEATVDSPEIGVDIENVKLSGHDVTWDEFNSGGSTADYYLVRLQMRAKGEGSSDWTTAKQPDNDGNETSTVKKVFSTDEESVDIEDDFDDVDDTLVDEMEYRVQVQAFNSDGKKISDITDMPGYYWYDDSDDDNAVVPGATGTDTEVAAPILGGLSANVATLVNPWGELTIQPGNADSYDVVLYKAKNATVATNDIDNVPTGAVKVTSVNVKNTDNSEEVNYSFGSDLAYSTGSDAYNFYFVTIVAKRSGQSNSDKFMSESIEVDSSINEDLSEPVFNDNVFKGIDAPSKGTTKPTVGIVEFDSDFDMGTDTIVLQLYKRVDGAAAVKVGSPVVLDDEDDDYSAKGFSYKYKDLDEANTSYYVTAVAKADGRPDSDLATSKSYTLEDSAVEPDSVDLDDEGKLTIDTQKAKGDEGQADSYTMQIMYKGVNVGKEHYYADSTSSADPYVEQTLTDNITGMIEEAGYDIDDDYDDLTVKVKGTKSGYADSSWISSTNTADAPDNAKWDLSSDNNPVATWNAVDNADSYKVTLYEANSTTDTTAGDEIDSLYTTKTSVNLSALLDEDDDSNALIFKVQSVNGNSKSSAVQSATPNFDFDYKLDDAENVMWDGNKSTWDAVKGADSYSVCKMVNGKQVGPTKTVTTNEIQFKGLSNPGVYTFAVMANSNDDGVVSSTLMESDYKVIVAKQPGTFKVTKATKTKTTVKLYWSKSSNVDVYRIYKKVNGTYKVYIKSVRGTATAKTVTGLKAGTANYFKVKAVNNGLYTFSNAKKATTLK